VNFTVIANAFPGPISYAYDELGRLVGVTTATGDAAKYSYDAVGNITSISRYSSSQSALFTFTPKFGPVGTQVTIYGSNFNSTPAQDTVSFNGTNASIVSASTTQIVVSVPSGTTSGPITVVSPAGPVTSTDVFTVTASSGKPRIDSFTPQIVAQGSTVTITGANFDLAPQNDRLVVNITAAVPPNSPAPTTTSLALTVPSSSGSGHVYLSTPNGTTVSTGDLFIPPPKSFYTPSQISYTGRTTLNAAATTVTATQTPQTLGLLLFDGIAGHAVSVSLAPVAGSEYHFQIYKPDGTSLGTGFSCSTPCFADSQQLPVSGTFAVGIDSGSATVTIYDSTVIAQSITPGGAAITLNPVPGQNAKLTFSGTAGQQATVQVSGNTISSVTVSILNPDGSTLTSLTSSASSFSFNAVTLTQSGTHTILVDPPGSNSGTITVGLVLQ
jgi:YD repeat-containing protein